MTNLFPEIEPYNTGLLNVSNENHLYYEQAGTPLGKASYYTTWRTWIRLHSTNAKIF